MRDLILSALLMSYLNLVGQDTSNIWFQAKYDLNFSKLSTGYKSSSSDLDNILSQYEILSVDYAFPEYRKYDELKNIYEATCICDPDELIKQVELADGLPLIFCERAQLNTDVDYVPNDYLYMGDPLWHLEKIIGSTKP